MVWYKRWWLWLIVFLILAVTIVIIIKPTLLFLPLLFLFVPGTLVALALLITFIVLLILFIAKKKKFLLIPLVLILLLFVYATFIVQAPVKGTARNALTGDSIEGISVEKIVHIEAFALSLEDTGGEKIYDFEITDNNGIYSFPWTLRITFPFVEMFDSTNVGISGIDNESCHGSRFGCQSDFLGKYHYQNYYYKNGRLLDKKNNVQMEDQIKFRYSILPVNVDIYLIPLVENIADCEKAEKTELVQACKNANAQDLAVKSLNQNICNSVSDYKIKSNCFASVTVEKKKIAEESQNKTLCESVNGVWDEGNCASPNACENMCLNDECVKNCLRCWGICKI